MNALEELRETVITWVEEHDEDLSKPHMVGFARRNISATHVRLATERGLATPAEIWGFICDMDGD